MSKEIYVMLLFKYFKREKMSSYKSMKLTDGNPQIHNPKPKEQWYHFDIYGVIKYLYFVGTIKFTLANTYCIFNAINWCCIYYFLKVSWLI